MRTLTITDRDGSTYTFDFTTSTRDAGRHASWLIAAGQIDVASVTVTR